MNLLDGEFTTEVKETFNIAITQESDCSLDGGYTFENVTNMFELDVSNAKKLLNELTDFIKKHSNKQINCK